MAQTAQALSVDPSLDRLSQSCKSQITAKIYREQVEKFCRYLNLSPVEAVRSVYDWPAIVGEYLASLESRNQHIGTRSLVVFALNRWFDANKIKLSERLKAPSRRGLSQKVRPIILTMEELRRIVSFADLPGRVIILLGLSTRLPASKLVGLKVRDLSSLQITGECRESVEAWIRLRTSRKEVITDDSFLCGKSPASYVSIIRKWKDALVRAGVSHSFPFGALGEYFEAWARIAGISNLKSIDAAQFQELSPALTLLSGSGEVEYEPLKRRIVELEDQARMLRIEKRVLMARLREQRRSSKKNWRGGVDGGKEEDEEGGEEAKGDAGGKNVES